MRILIVDDESSVLQSLLSIVKPLPGHTVRVAANAEKAKEHAAALGGVDLLITDVVMEPTDGFALRVEMTALYPALQTVFISGYDLTEYADQIGGAPVLAKPVDAEILRSEIGVAQLRLAPAPAAPKPAATAIAVAVPAVAKAIAVAVPAVAKAAAAPSASPASAASPAPAPVAVAKAVAAPSASPASAVQPVPAPAAVVKVVKVVVAPPASPPPGPTAPAIRAAVSVPLAKAAPPPPAIPVAPVVADPLIGVQLGDYRVQELIGHGKWGKVYLATQLSVNRRVSLKVLDSERAQDGLYRAHFLADARAKAAVQHPFITPVFEADERNGLVFLAQEYLDGANMQERIERGQLLEEKTALHVLKVASESLQYLWSHNISHSLIDASCLRLGGDNIARLVNLATADGDPSVTTERELLAVAGIIRQLTPEQSMSGGLRALLGRMSGGPNPVTSWLVVLQAVKALEPKVIPVEAGKIKAADAAAMRAVEAARLAKKRSHYFSFITLGALVLLLGFVVWRYYASSARKLDVQVQIPAGKYMVGDPKEGNQADLGAFEIDKYEVSINDYAQFVRWCEKYPDREHEFDHPRGERRLSHVNENVKKLILKAYARGERVFKQADDPGAEIDLNCPVVGVTFWDAYAYARWRGKIVEGGVARDLPTEEEWEAAARGTRGLKYPWGDEPKPGNFNSNQGYNSLKPGGTKTEDGFNYWAPVDQFAADKSEFKVIGMAGNVLEWVYRKEGNKEIPLLKGGSFASDPIPLWGRILTIPADDTWFVYPAKDKGRVPANRDPETPQLFVGDPVTASVRTLYVGFRTVKRK